MRNTAYSVVSLPVEGPLGPRVSTVTLSSEPVFNNQVLLIDEAQGGFTEPGKPAAGP